MLMLTKQIKKATINSWPFFAFKLPELDSNQHSQNQNLKSCH